jgi:ribonuclease P protein component
MVQQRQNVMRVERLKQSADFQRLLNTPIKQRSAHFAIHHVMAVPSHAAKLENEREKSNLSTDRAETCSELVDDLPTVLWLGCLVPKRHARRSVTRSLLKRQMRGAAERAAVQLPGGLALLRMRQPFPSDQYPSASSQALRLAARQELEQLVQRFVLAAQAAQAQRTAQRPGSA